MIASCAEALQIIFVPVKHVDSRMGFITIAAKLKAGICAILVERETNKNGQEYQCCICQTLYQPGHWYDNIYED